MSELRKQLWMTRNKVKIQGKSWDSIQIKKFYFFKINNDFFMEGSWWFLRPVTGALEKKYIFIIKTYHLNVLRSRPPSHFIIY